MGLRAFITIPKDNFQRVVFFLSWFCWVTGMALLAFQLYQIIAWSFNFPYTSGIRSSAWCLLFSIQIFTMWLPFALLLQYWRKKKMVIHVVYISGCALTWILAVIAIILVDRYKMEGKVRMEYLEATDKYIKDKQALPPWIGAGSATFGTRCCGWYSPIDIGAIFPVTEKLSKNKKFMEGVAECFGIYTLNETDKHTFTLEIKKNLNPVYNPSKPVYPYGCGQVYKEKARMMCYFSVYCGLMIALMSLVFIGLYVFDILKTRTYKGMKGSEDNDDLDKEKGRYSYDENATYPPTASESIADPSSMATSQLDYTEGTESGRS